MKNAVKKPVSLADRLDAADAQDEAAALDLLYRPPAFFFQGIAALTGMRCQRENLECWSRRGDEYYEDIFGPCREEKNFRRWLFGAGYGLVYLSSAAVLARLLLEPMYWLEKFTDTEKGDAEK